MDSVIHITPSSTHILRMAYSIDHYEVFRQTGLCIGHIDVGAAVLDIHTAVNLAEPVLVTRTRILERLAGELALGRHNRSQSQVHPSPVGVLVSIVNEARIASDY